MFAPLPFALHATAGCPPHAELALSLACCFEDVDAAALDAELDAIASLLPTPSSEHPLAELKSLTGLAARCVRPPDEVDTEGVLLHTALASEAPHPLTLAIIGAELARRRGMAIGIVSNGEDHCLAHTELAVPLLVPVETGQVLDAHSLAPTLTWRCAHETAGLLLDELEPRFLAQGRLDKALHAAELRLCLPFDENGKRIAERKRQRVRARLN
jgi:hypothetical protein